MREIKFRAWLEGIHKDTDSEPMRIIESKMEYGVEVSGKGNYYMVGGNVSEYPTIPIMQFTGLKDKNGNEIYEGDILSSTELDADIVVEWLAEDAYWSCKDAHDGEEYGLLSMTYIHKSNKKTAYSVIGNIYENPELLKNKAEL